MSWDLVVYAARRVDLDDAAEGVSVDIEARPGGFMARRQVRGVIASAFTGDGPLMVEREDLPEPVAVSGVGLRVAYELSVPAGAASTVHRSATRLARRMADAADGVVYDPQDDRVVWPRSSRRDHTRPASQRLTTVDFSWYFPDDQAETALTHLFDVVGAWWPEAMPRRFGEIEPLQHRFDHEGAEGLLALARREGGAVFWTASRPFMGGHADLQVRPDPSAESHESRTLPGSRRMASVSMTVDARAAAVETWRNDLIEGFVTSADRMNCVYAQAQVTRGWGYTGGRLWADDRTGPGTAKS